ncbi:MAG: hypothetical protein JXR89_02435 [Deltaproteobacteria bacterium]|nr:hypothetical protein [Deltaproteobacteria bacterium]
MIKPEVFAVVWRSVLLCLMAIFCVACTSKDVRVRAVEEVPPFTRIAVMPFDVSGCQSCAQAYPSCRPDGGKIICDQIDSGIGYELALSLAREIAIHGKYKVVEPETAVNVLPLVGQAPMTEIGRRLGVEVLLFGAVNRFEERVGGPISALSPASVFFEVAMVDARSGRKVWYAVFDQTQKSLSDDITNLRNFMRGGGRWLTAREFADVGIAELVENFPGLGRSQIKDDYHTGD